METMLFVLIAFLSPLSAIRRVPASLYPGWWYMAGVLFAAWIMQVVAPVVVILGILVAFFILEGISHHS